MKKIYHWLTAFLRRLFTRSNPVFLVTNVFRDRRKDKPGKLDEPPRL
jgi:hypothetical protein